MFYLKISIRNLKVCIFVFLIKIESSTDNDNDVLAGTIPVNNFFAHWLKEGDKKNGDHIPVLPLLIQLTYIGIQRQCLNIYLKKLLKHLKKLFCIVKKVALIGGRDRRLNNTTTAADTTDENLTERASKF